MHDRENIAYRFDEVVDLRFRDNERRSDLEHHEIVSADLLNDVGVVMSGVLDAVSGEKIEDRPPLGGFKLRTCAASVAKVLYRLWTDEGYKSHN